MKGRPRQKHHRIVNKMIGYKVKSKKMKMAIKINTGASSSEKNRVTSSYYHINATSTTVFPSV